MALIWTEHFGAVLAGALAYMYAFRKASAWRYGSEFWL